VALVPESDEAQEFVHLDFEGAARNPAQAAGKLQVLAAAEVGVPTYSVPGVLARALQE